MKLKIINQKAAKIWVKYFNKKTYSIMTEQFAQVSRLTKPNEASKQICEHARFGIDSVLKILNEKMNE